MKIILLLIYKKLTKAYKAGGANTNLTGLRFEKETEININITELCSNMAKCILNDKELVKLTKNNFAKYFNLNTKDMAHGTKQPDEAYVNEKAKVIYIIEKNFQQRSGSVCEKLQTGVFKRYFLQSKLKNYHVEYIYSFTISC